MIVAEEAPAPPKAPGRVPLRVWELPVRVTHWAIVAAVVVLSVTGFYIGTPVLSVGGETGFLMGKMRAVHLVSSWVLIAAVLARIAWAFLGNRWARWDQFVPASRARRRLLVEALRFYALLRREPPHVVGHNPLAGLTYLVLYLAVFGAQIFTGLALASLPDRSGVLWALSGWVFSVAAIPVVRLVHHLLMWVILAFLVAHVYIAVLVDREERAGIVSSIITGYKEVPPDWT